MNEAAFTMNMMGSTYESIRSKTYTSSEIIAKHPDLGAACSQQLPATDVVRQTRDVCQHCVFRGVADNLAPGAPNVDGVYEVCALSIATSTS